MSIYLFSWLLDIKWKDICPIVEWYCQCQGEQRSKTSRQQELSRLATRSKTYSAKWRLCNMAIEIGCHCRIYRIGVTPIIKVRDRVTSLTFVSLSYHLDRTLCILCSMDCGTNSDFSSFNPNKLLPLAVQPFSIWGPESYLHMLPPSFPQSNTYSGTNQVCFMY